MPSLSSRSRASGSVASTPVRERTAAAAQELPPYEAPIAPLSEEAQRSLDALLQAHSTRRLKIHLDNATTSITEIAGSINDAGSVARENDMKKRARAEANGETRDEAEVEKLETLIGRIESLTQRLDSKMREVVDNFVFLEDLPEVMNDVRAKMNETSTQATTNTLSQSQPRARRMIDEDEEGETTMDTESQEVDEQPSQSVAPRPETAASTLFKASLTSQADIWNSKTLTSRYSNANAYIGFYRTVYDAKNPGDSAPPIPNPNTWFAAEENPDASVLEEPAPDDEDIEIATERISTKCPITLLEFRDPVTSTKCPHSFERSAIMSMMRRPTVPRSQWSQTQTQQEKEVACPVCSLRLTANDLRSDPALLRKVKRVEAARKRAEEENSEDEDDEDAPRGTQKRAQLVGSSPASASKSMARRVKEERLSGLGRASSTHPGEPRATRHQSRGMDIDRVPGTQITDGGAIMVDLGDDDEDEDEDEHDLDDDVEESM